MNQKTLFIIISVLCCLLTAAVAVTIDQVSNADAYVTRETFRTICRELHQFEQENRDDHKEIRRTLRDILREVGRLESALK